MKHYLLLSSLFALSASAQAPKEVLFSLGSSDQLEYTEFTYNEFSKVLTRTYIEYSESLLCVDTHTYDDKQQLTSILTEQDLTGGLDFEKLQPACRVDYQYDERGNRIGRDNFNRRNGQLEHSAHIAYNYDEDNRLVSEEQFWAFDPEAPFFRIVYTYNEEGQRVSAEEFQQDWFEKDVYKFSGRLEYYYDDEGRLDQTAYFYVTGRDAETGEDYVELMNTEQYYYSAAGDVSKHEVLSASGKVTNRETYYYDEDVPVEDVAYPATPEYVIGQLQYAKHKVTREEIFGTNLNTGELTYSHSMVYNYEPNTVGIDRVQADANGLTVDYNAESRSLRLEGNADGASVRIVSASGQTLLSTATATGEHSISTGELTPGTYIAIVHKPGQGTVAQKFMVR